MNISYITKFKTLDITNWSGTEYFIAKSLENEGANLDVIGGLKEKINLSLRIKARLYGRPPHELYVLLKSPEFAKNYARQIDKKINSKTDIVFASAANDTLAYLKTKKPKVFYNDTTFPLMYGYYNWYENICKKTYQEAMKVERLSLNNAQLVIYSSDWAAQSAINDYNISPSKVKVVPFGANISTVLSTSDISQLINTKEAISSCQILFIGVEWYRKGGDIVLEAVKYLNEELNLPTVLHLVGLNEIPVPELPSYVINHGRISKTTKEGMLEIEKLILESHFLFVPSRAEAFGIVFCEAMAFGVPCISTNTGGIPTIIKNRENGFLQDKDASPKEYANTIYEAFTNKNLYRQVSLAAYQDYQDRLNWDAAGKKVMQYLKDLV